MRYDEIRKIEELSEYILDKYDVKVPITNIEKLVEKIGGTVVYENLGREHNHIIKTGNKSFLIKIDNCYIQKDNKNNDKILKKMIADELGYLFLYMGYKTNSELWNSIPINEKIKTDYEQLVAARVFGEALLMPKEEFIEIIEKIKMKMKELTYRLLLIILKLILIQPKTEDRQLYVLKEYYNFIIKRR